jgi:hypothetical protein
VMMIYCKISYFFAPVETHKNGAKAVTAFQTLSFACYYTLTSHAKNNKPITETSFLQSSTNSVVAVAVEIVEVRWL